MAEKPADRGTRRARRGEPAGAQWLVLPGWRKPLDALLVLAVAAATAWIALVVVPATTTPATTAAPSTSAAPATSSAPATSTPSTTTSTPPTTSDPVDTGTAP